MFNLVEKVLCVEVLEKISRMQRFLCLEPDIARQQGKDVVAIFVAALDGVLDNLEPIVRRLSEEVELDRLESVATVRRLSDIMDSVDELHLQLQLIHGTWVRPETDIFIKSVLEFIPKARRPREVSVILSNSYMFEESDLSSFFEYVLRTTNVSVAIQTATPTVFLPKIERDNPLNWANLVHECGHADYEGIDNLLRRGDIIPAGVRGANRRTLRRWAEELYCDIFATRVLGPAYLLSFITFVLALGGAEEPSETHPAPIVRIWVIREVLEKNNLKVSLSPPSLGYEDASLFFLDIIEKRTELDRRYVYSIVSSPQLPWKLHDFVDVISEQIDKSISLGRLLTPGDFSRVENLAIRLSKGIPIASHTNPQLVDSAKKSIKKAGSDVLKFKRVRKAVQEQRTLLWEIINAGWLHKIQSIYPSAFSQFFTPNGPPLKEKIVVWRDELEETDILLLKSIESSRIQELMEKDMPDVTV